MRNPFKRGKHEQRTISTFPWNYGMSGYAEVSQERALTLVPVYASVRLLAGTVSTLPLKAYRRVGDERQPMPGLPRLFADLDLDGRLVPWLHQAVTSLALRGNAYGLITGRDGYQFPTGVEWLDPSAVTVDDTRPGRPGWYWNGRRVEQDEMVHIPLFAQPGKREGLSPIGAYAATINTGLNAVNYGQSWFENGGFPPGTFKNTQQTVSQEQAGAIKARLAAAIRSREPLVYGADWQYDAVTVPPGEAQFIETQKLTATQIATIYGIPPEMIGGETGSSMTYANVEQQQINFLTFTLRPWLVVLEHAFAAILPERQYVKFNGDAVIRTDIKTRWEMYKLARDIGAISVNEIRALEERPPIPGGDLYLPTPAEQPVLEPPAPGQRMWRVP